MGISDSLPWTPCPCSLSFTNPLKPLILTPSSHCSGRLMVRVEYLGVVHTRVWTQPHPLPPAPLQGPSPQLRVSEEAEYA